MQKPIKTLKELYCETLSSNLGIDKDEFTDRELLLIDHTFDIFKSKLEEIKILQDDNKRITIDLLNLRSYIKNETDEEE